MPQSRKDIRDAVVALLSGNTNAGTNVYANRETAVWGSELPAIFVYTKDETAEPRDLSGRTYVRKLELVIEIKASANETVDDDLDAIAGDVEDIISANRSLSATAQTAVYKSTNITLDAGSETEKGVASLIFEVQYTK